MRIAYVGNFGPSHSTENHIAGSLRLLGHEVVELQENEQVDVIDTLAQRVLDAGCSMLLYTKTWGLPPEQTLAQWALLDAAGVPTVSYHLDLYFGLDREEQLDREPFWRTRFVFSADGAHDDEFAAHGIDHEWLRPGVYGPECVNGTPQSRLRRVKVGFVGSHRWYHAEWPYRQQLVKWLRSTYRSQFVAFPTGHQAVRGQALNDLYASVPVFVGDSLCPNFTQPRYWSDRVYETLGRGGFLIHPRIEGLDDEFVDGEHLRYYTFGDFDELRGLVDHYVAHPDEARAIAACGQAFVREHCTYERRVSDMLDRLTAKGALHDVAAGEHSSHSVRLGRWTARFDPRDGDVDVHDGSFTVVDEVWRNDYRLDVERGLQGTVIDVGANVGAFTVLAAKAGAQRVIAVEPEAANRERLEHHVRLNGVEHKVTILPLAVTDGATFTVAMQGTGGGAQLSHDGHDVGLVHTVTLEELLREHSPVELLKVDIEGAEFAAFAELPVECLALVRRIVMEWHGPAMPHLTHLRGDEFGPLVTKLADAGRVETFGHPVRGGLIHWRRY